jgi:cytochrome c oxidase subunit 3
MSPIAELKIPKQNLSGNGRGTFNGSDGCGFRGGKEPQPVDRYPIKLLGLWLFLATIVMFFASITSALIVRRAAPDWTPIYFPRILWLNTLLLLASSATLELSRRTLKKSWTLHLKWLGFTAILGSFFLTGQVYAWEILANHGLFLPTNPHSSFFYLITCLHGIHLLAGIVWLLTSYRIAQKEYDIEERAKSLNLLAIFWHFLDLLWLYLFGLLLMI